MSLAIFDEFADYPHCQDAYTYAQHVVNGHKLACKWEKLACQRFLDDLIGRTPYQLDRERAEKAVRFIELLPHVKGKWAAKSEKLRLEPWQKFIIVNLFGWVDSEGKRRFREAYCKIPRKNGKSMLAAAIALKFFAADDEHGAEVYSGATTEKQAWEVFRPAREICKRTPTLVERYGITIGAKNLAIIPTGSRFEPVIGNPGDGSSPSLAIVDEYHEHSTDDLFETMKTGMGAREQPLMFSITTSGSNIAGPCYMAEVEYKKILDRVYEDERIFAIIYGIDDGDDWTTEEALIKANPNFDISVSRQFLVDEQQAAIRTAAKQNTFKRKYLNQWVGAHVAWLNMEHINACIDPDLKIENFHHQPCIFALDLASRIDLTAFVQMFTHTENGKKHYTAFVKFYLPEATVFDERNAHYQRWVNEGWITATEGEEIDFNEIQQQVIEDMANYSVNQIVYDPWRAAQIGQALMAAGASAVEYRNTVNNMSAPMYELEAAINSGRFHYDGNPVLTWMFSNVVAKINTKEQITPQKEKRENKIDGVVALIMAVGGSMGDQNQPSVYEQRGIRTL